MDAGLAGGIIGGAFGILGGVIGTFFSLKNTQSPRERQFMIRVAVGTWLGVTLFLVLLLLLPSPYRFGISIRSDNFRYTKAVPGHRTPKETRAVTWRYLP